MFILRSETNKAAIMDEIAKYKVAKSQVAAGVTGVLLPPLPNLNQSRPGDYLVTRDFRTVYEVFPDGSNRTIGGDQATKAIDTVKMYVAELRRRAEQPVGEAPGV